MATTTSLTFPKEMRVLRRSDFRALASSSNKRLGRFLVIELRPIDSPLSKLGITVTRKFGKATVRNRFKRRLREAFRHLAPSMPQSFAMNVRPRQEAKEATQKEIALELAALLESQS